MHRKAKSHNSIFWVCLEFGSGAHGWVLVLIVVVLFIVFTTQPMQGQTYKVIYNFTGGQDGANPEAGLIMDRAGNLYGTAPHRGSGLAGTVYKLNPNPLGWRFNLLYSFTGGSDGANPSARVIFGPDGALYGTTLYGGNLNCGPYDLGCGTVFKVRPLPTACRTVLCPWTETVLHSFQGGDGSGPESGDLLFDRAGSIYGTTGGGGAYDDGTVYELTPSGSGWTESVLHNFGGADGIMPRNGVILDNAGRLYGTTYAGGPNNDGLVFQLTQSGSGWTENILYSFANGNDGGYPSAGLIFDQLGNLYGAADDGAAGGGIVFELSPSGGGWTFSLLYSIRGGGINCEPTAPLVMDEAGNLFGTTACQGRYFKGSVFKLTASSPYWTYTSLHDFTGGSDGEFSPGGVIIDADGNLYGTAYGGGNQNCSGGCGVVWEITP